MVLFKVVVTCKYSSKNDEWNINDTQRRDRRFANMYEMISYNATT